MEFPIFKTKIENSPKFDFSDPRQRAEYFELKAGPEISKLKKYMEKNTFIAHLLGKKNSGKGTYSKMFAEIVGTEKIEHFSVGDMVRDIDKEFQDPEKKKNLIEFLEKNYRGFIDLDNIIKSLEDRSTKNLLPNELILALIKREIEKRDKKSLFIDGFPRNFDQVGFSLFFRELVDYRKDPDVLILIDVPTNILSERIKYRRVCPVCQTSRNLQLLPTSNIGYRKETGEFFLKCDNPECKGVEMKRKEGDEAGIEPIRERLEVDEKLLRKFMSLYGIPKVLLRNAIPVDVAGEYVNNYELTPEYHYNWNEEKEEVEIIEKPWTVKDDIGTDCYSLMAAPVVVSLIKQLTEALGLN